MGDWFVARYQRYGGAPEWIKGVDDSFLAEWEDLGWPEGPQGQMALASPDESEYAVRIPDGRVLIYTDLDEMYEAWSDMEERADD